MKVPSHTSADAKLIEHVAQNITEGEQCVGVTIRRDTIECILRFANQIATRCD
jgi:hypothetical protein